MTVQSPSGLITQRSVVPATQAIKVGTDAAATHTCSVLVL